MLDGWGVVRAPEATGLGTMLADGHGEDAPAGAPGRLMVDHLRSEGDLLAVGRPR